MGWMTQAEAQTASGLTSIADFTTASQFVTWALGNGSCVRTSDTYEIVPVFSANGIYLKQRVDTSEYEVRGLEREFANNLAKYMRYDNTHTWTYYAIDPDGNLQTAHATEAPPASGTASVYYKAGFGSSWQSVSGVKVPDQNVVPYKYRARATRANGADGWRVVISYTRYRHLPYGSDAQRDGGVWFIPTVPNEVKTGIVVSRSSSKTHLATSINNYSLYQLESSVATEYRFLSETEANAKANEVQNNSRVFIAPYQVAYSTGSGSRYIYVNVRGGGTNGLSPATDVKVATRYVGGGEGWTATVTAVTYQGVEELGS